MYILSTNTIFYNCERSRDTAPPRQVQFILNIFCLGSHFVVFLNNTQAVSYFSRLHLTGHMIRSWLIVVIMLCQSTKEYAWECVCCLCKTAPESCIQSWQGGAFWSNSLLCILFMYAFTLLCCFSSRNVFLRLFSLLLCFSFPIFPQW